MSRLKEGLALFAAGGAIILVWVSASHLGSLPPADEDPAWWHLLFWTIVAAGVFCAFLGAVYVLWAALGRPIRVVRSRTRGYGIRFEIVRPIRSESGDRRLPPGASYHPLATPIPQSSTPVVDGTHARPGEVFPHAAGVPLPGVAGVLERRMQLDLDRDDDQPAPAPKLSITPEELAASIGPDDVIRALNGLYERGERLIAKFAGLPNPAPEGAWREATLSLSDWLDNVAQVLETRRPRLVVPLRDARARRPRTLSEPGKAMVVLDATAFYQDQIREVLKLLRHAIGE